MKVKKIIGYCMISSIFIVLFIFGAIAKGLMYTTLIYLGITLFLCFTWVGVSLIVKN